MNKSGQRIDFHSHILHRMDDGSLTPEMSLDMLREQMRQGVDHIVLTPHFYASSDYPEHFLTKRRQRLEELTANLTPGMPVLIPGAEVQYFDGITAMEELPQMRIGRSRCLLIEMPFLPWTGRMLDDILELTHRGQYRIILAHIERYLSYGNEPALRKLADSGVLMQANSASFQGIFRSRKMLRLLDDGLIHLLGSDCHNTAARPPNLETACSFIEKKRGADVLQNIMNRGLHLLNETTE